MQVWKDSFESDFGSVRMSIPKNTARLRNTQNTQPNGLHLCHNTSHVSTFFILQVRPLSKHASNRSATPFSIYQSTTILFGTSEWPEDRFDSTARRTYKRLGDSAQSKRIRVGSRELRTRQYITPAREVRSVRTTSN